MQSNSPNLRTALARIVAAAKVALAVPHVRYFASKKIVELDKAILSAEKILTQGQ
jgi:hypothetical protein